MTTREKLQAIVDGGARSHVPPPYGKRMELFTAAQIIPMLEQAYRLALEDAATFCDNQSYMILDPLRTRTANDECDAIKASVKFIGNSLRRMAEQIGG